MKKISFNVTYASIICIICLFTSQAQAQSFKQVNTPNKTQIFKVNELKPTTEKTLEKHKRNHLSLYGALSLNQQTINDAGITTPVNYLYNAVNNDVFKPGYSGGFRWDGNLHKSNSYSILVGVNKVSAGTFYKNKYTIAPLPDEFTHFKADNSFTTINLGVHFKKLLPINKMDKYKFYAIAGPSIDYKISKITNENLINGAGNRTFLNADLGAEFDNKGYYVIFAHYKIGANLLKNTVPTQLNRFEIGMSIKAKDLF